VDRIGDEGFEAVGAKYKDTWGKPDESDPAAIKN
jgi:hypothetical protein